MEIVAESGVGSYSPCDISNEVKPQTAGVGFRIKSGWAAVVLLTGSIDSPRLSDNRVIDLSDPQFPETRQPYHAATGKLETDTKKTNRRRDIVQRVTKQSIMELLADYRRKGYAITRACLVAGSQIDPATIANPHIRAHAFEGQLFRSVLEQALNAHRIRTVILLERDAYSRAAAELKKSIDDVRRTIENFGGSAEGPWRAEQKLAALAAWVAVFQNLCWSKRKTDEDLYRD
jgi:hypothetical protein